MIPLKVQIEEIKAQIDKLNDTGWINMSSYIDTTYYAIRENYIPQVRIKNGIAYWRGEIYCKTAPSSSYGYLSKTIPNEYRPRTQISGAGMQWDINEPYNIFIDHIGNICIRNSDNIKVTRDFQGYQLSNIPPYPID